MRFASHRDIARAVERGVRRARLPIAYSAGFTPHPKISYAGAAPTGTASEAEYLELSLTEPCIASEVRERLDAALPDGMDVIEVTEAPASLAALSLEASLWSADLPGVAPHEAARAVDEFLGCQTVEVERLTSKGIRRVDARAAVISMHAGAATPESSQVGELSGAATGNAILRMVVRHVVPAVRPDDILTALRHVAALAPSSPPVVTRLAQGALHEVCGAGARGASQGETIPGVAPAGPAVSSAGGNPPEPPAMGPQAPRRSVAAKQVETTRPGEVAALAAASHPAGACNQFPRGADGPEQAGAPGSLTGDSPDARERAAQQRFQQ